MSLLLLCFISHITATKTRIAILEFELKDLTLAPRIPNEIKRTASIKPLLEGALKTADYSIASIDHESQVYTNNGIGCLFDHHDVTAKLGKKFNANYILAGRLHKPSFLFAYLMGAFNTRK